MAIDESMDYFKYNRSVCIGLNFMNPVLTFAENFQKMENS